jgi:hypothetical protein
MQRLKELMRSCVVLCQVRARGAHLILHYHPFANLRVGGINGGKLLQELRANDLEKLIDACHAASPTAVPVLQRRSDDLASERSGSSGHDRGCAAEGGNVDERSLIGLWSALAAMSGSDQALE